MALSLSRHFLGTSGILVLVLMMSACTTVPFGAAPVSENPAVLALADTARNDVAAYQYARAAAGLERALRIEPRNARLWHELAQVRAFQEQYQQAESLAQRSNRFAGDNRQLLRANWNLIAECRKEMGDAAGAQAAQDKSMTFK
jgi:cytochrome c-type biogenesis protein CcmH/NrfG